MAPPKLKIKKRTEWRLNRSIIAGRSKGGQIIWRGRSDTGAADVFLLRVGKDAGRQMVGSPQAAVRKLEKLRLELGRPLRCAGRRRRERSGGAMGRMGAAPQ